MPELPEVEVVRRGVAKWVVGRTIQRVHIFDVRSLRRHPAGPSDFCSTLAGMTVTDAQRRGKFLWLPVTQPGEATPSRAILVHLGMSGQVLMQEARQPAPRHERVRFELSRAVDAHGQTLPEHLRFVDQRIFGGLMLDPLVPSAHDGRPVPEHASHIAPDPLERDFDVAVFHRALRRRRTELKRALLDQGLISGIGNIYADEALWTARLHWAARTHTMTAPRTRRLVEACQDVMRRALDAGGTSFDSLYVNVNGESGYFSRGLNVYGRTGEACPRCGTPIKRVSFMNRSSHFCPKCQPKPRSLPASFS